jgi:hypothetical protein
MASNPVRRRTSATKATRTDRARTKRRPWRLPAVLAAIALCLVWVYSVDINHAAAIVAGAIVMGLCNEFADGLSTQRLRPVKLKGLEQGATEQQFLAYSLTGDRPVGERAYRHFGRLAKGRLAKLGVRLEVHDGGKTGGGDAPGTGRPGAGAYGGRRLSGLLYSAITDPERGARMTHADLSACLDELDALEQSQRTQQESRPTA